MASRSRPTCISQIRALARLRSWASGQGVTFSPAWVALEGRLVNRQPVDAEFHKRFESSSAQVRLSCATADTVEEVQTVIYADLVLPGGNLWDFYLGKARWWILRFCQHDAERAKWARAGAEAAPLHYQRSAGRDGLTFWWAQVNASLSPEMIDESLSVLELLFNIALASCQLEPQLPQARAQVGLPRQASTTRGLNGNFPPPNPSSNDDGDNDRQRVGLFEPR